MLNTIDGRDDQEQVSHTQFNMSGVLENCHGFRKRQT